MRLFHLASSRRRIARNVTILSVVAQLEGKYQRGELGWEPTVENTYQCYEGFVGLDLGTCRIPDYV
jgi:hypothetical protein